MDREIDDHDAVLFDDAHQHEHADKRVERSLLAEQIKRQQTAHQRRRQSREHGQRMQIAFIENRQDHVHDEDRQRHENGQIAHGILKRQRFALQARRAASAARFPPAALLMKSVASPMATPGLRLKNSVTLVN